MIKAVVCKNRIKHQSLLKNCIRISKYSLELICANYIKVSISQMVIKCYARERDYPRKVFACEIPLKNQFNMHNRKNGKLITTCHA